MHTHRTRPLTRGNDAHRAHAQRLHHRVEAPGVAGVGLHLNVLLLLLLLLALLPRAASCRHRCGSDHCPAPLLLMLLGLLGLVLVVEVLLCRLLRLRVWHRRQHRRRVERPPAAVPGGC